MKSTALYLHYDHQEERLLVDVPDGYVHFFFADLFHGELPLIFYGDDAYFYLHGKLQFPRKSKLTLI